MSCDLDKLDALLHGELAKAERTALTDHARGCDPCGRELQLLTAERELFAARALRHAPAPALRRAVLQRCEALAERSRRRSQLVGGFGFALTLLFVTFAPLRQSPAVSAVEHEVNASFCDQALPQTSFSRALHCGGGELVAQAETAFHACLVASPLLPGFGPDACE